MTHGDAPEDRWPEIPVIYCCPGCQPLVDTSREIVTVRWCSTHEPSVEGVEDRGMTRWEGLSGGADAGGETNRAWCATVHQQAPSRGQPPTIPRGPVESPDDPFCIKCGANMTLMGTGWVCGRCGWSEGED